MSKPLTVLIIHNFYRERGGEDEYVESLDLLLRENRQRVLNYYHYSRSFAGLIPIARFATPLYTCFRDWFGLQSIIRRERPDIVHLHNIFPSISPIIFRVLKHYRIPIVQTVHNFKRLCLNGLFLLNNGSVCERCMHGNFIHGVARKCYQGSLFKSAAVAGLFWWQRLVEQNWSSVDVFICPTAFVGQKLRAGGCPPEKIVEIPHFISEKQTVTEAPISEAPYAVYIGRLSREKGVNTMIRAFAPLKHVPLKVIGHGPLETEIKNQISKSQLNHIEMLGSVDETTKSRILSGAACLIFPSECYETFGLSLIESLQAGVPVIATRFGGRREIIQDGLNGILFDCGDVEQLRTAVLKLVRRKDGQGDFSAEARKTFLSQFSSDVIYSKLMNCYENLVVNT